MRYLLAILALLFTSPVQAQDYLATARPIAVAKAVNAASVVLKANSGWAHGVNVVNSDTGIAYVVMYDALAIPADGALDANRILYCVSIPVGGTIRDNFVSPIPFNSGISLFTSSAGCATKTSVTVRFIGGQVR